jgi:hypothetical protein
MSNVVNDIFGAVTGSTQADAATQAAQTAANAQMQGLQFIQKQEQPYQQAGQQALSQYQALLNGGAANFDISKLPGYNFEMQQGQQALQNSAAARGGALSGNTIQATQQFGQGLASTQFQQYMQQLAGLTNMGQNAASLTGQAGNAAIAGAGASLASGQQAAGNATAAAYGNIASIIGGNAFNGGLNNSGSQSALASIFGG